MKIAVIGLGLIGGSIAKAIKEQTDHTVLGADIVQSVLLRAKLTEAIDDELTEANLPECETVIIALYPDDAEELKGLRDYTDDAAQTAYTENYSQHIYLDEDGQEQVGIAAVQSGHFAAAEIYREATVLSILNDYREDAAYSFRYTIN